MEGVVAEAAPSTNVLARRGILGRPRRDINVMGRSDGSTERRPLAITADASGESYSAVNSSSVTAKFQPKLYVPERLRKTMEPTSGSQSQFGAPSSTYSSSPHEGALYTSRVIRGRDVPEPAEDPTKSVLSTTRGLFQLRPKRNIRVKSFDELESDPVAPRAVVITRTTDPMEGTTRPDILGSVNTGGFIHEPSAITTDRLARRSRQTITDMLGSASQTVGRPPHTNIPGAPSGYTPDLTTGSLHPQLASEPTNHQIPPLAIYPDQDLDISHDLAPEYVPPYQPAPAQYSPEEIDVSQQTRWPPIGSEINDIVEHPHIMQNGSSAHLEDEPDLKQSSFVEHDLGNNFIEKAAVDLSTHSYIPVGGPRLIDNHPDSQKHMTKSEFSETSQMVIAPRVTPSESYQDHLAAITGRLQVAPPASEVTPSESYQDRLAAITSRLQVAPPASEAPPVNETIDEKKERILRQLMQRKMEAAAAVATRTTDPNFETLEQKKERIFAQLRQKHSANSQATELLNQTVQGSRLQGHDILGLSTTLPSYTRSRSLGATLGMEPMDLYVEGSADNEDIFSRHLEPRDLYGEGCADNDDIFSRRLEPRDIYDEGRADNEDIFSRNLEPRDLYGVGPQTDSRVDAVDIFADPMGVEPCDLYGAASQSHGHIDTDEVFSHPVPASSYASSGTAMGGNRFTSESIPNPGASQPQPATNHGEDRRSNRTSPFEDKDSVDSGFHGADGVTRDNSPTSSGVASTERNKSTSKNTSSSESQYPDITKGQSLPKTQKAKIQVTLSPVKVTPKVTPKVMPKAPRAVESLKSVNKEVTDEDSSEESLIRPSDVKAASGSLLLKKGAPQTKPKPGAKTSTRTPTVQAKPPMPKAHTSRTPMKTQQPPRPKSAPPSKSKSIANLCEMTGSPRMDRRASTVSSRDDMSDVTSPFSRSGRLRSSTRAWEARQAEKQAEINVRSRSNSTSGNATKVPPAAAPRPATPKKSVITGQVSLSPERAANAKDKATHTARTSSQYDKPWRTGTTLAKPPGAGSFTIRSAQPNVLPEQPKKHISGSSSSSSSRAESPSGRPKNPVKEAGSVVDQGCLRSRAITAKTSSPGTRSKLMMDRRAHTAAPCSPVTRTPSPSKCTRSSAMRTPSSTTNRAPARTTRTPTSRNLSPVSCNMSPTRPTPSTRAPTPTTPRQSTRAPTPTTPKQSTRAPTPTTPKPSTRAPTTSRNTPTPKTKNATTPRPFNFSYVPRSRRSSVSSDLSDIGSDIDHTAHEDNPLNDFLYEDNQAHQAEKELYLARITREWLYGDKDVVSPDMRAVSPDSGLCVHTPGSTTPRLTGADGSDSFFNNWIHKPDIYRLDNNTTSDNETSDNETSDNETLDITVRSDNETSDITVVPTL